MEAVASFVASELDKNHQHLAMTMLNDAMKSMATSTSSSGTAAGFVSRCTPPPLPLPHSHTHTHPPAHPPTHHCLMIISNDRAALLLISSRVCKYKSGAQLAGVFSEEWMSCLVGPTTPPVARRHCLEVIPLKSYFRASVQQIGP